MYHKYILYVFTFIFAQTVLSPGMKILSCPTQNLIIFTNLNHLNQHIQQEIWLYKLLVEIFLLNFYQ